jgi:hypothetical protein
MGAPPGCLPRATWDQGALQVRPGVRRAGRPTAEPGADAGPAAPQAPRLIYIWLNSATQRDDGVSSGAMTRDDAR